MKFTGVIRPIDDLGRVVLPIELRKSLNIEKKDLLEIFVDGSNIILKKHQKSCVFCENTDELTDFKGKTVCKNCIKNLVTIDSKAD